MHSSQSSKALTEASRARAAVSPAPILTDQPPRAFTASKPASSVRSSPAKKGIRPANGGSPRKAAITLPLSACFGLISNTLCRAGLYIDPPPAQPAARRRAKPPAPLSGHRPARRGNAMPAQRLYVRATCPDARAPFLPAPGASSQAAPDPPRRETQRRAPRAAQRHAHRRAAVLRARAAHRDPLCCALKSPPPRRLTLVRVRPILRARARSAAHR